MQITVNDIAINHRFDGPDGAPIVVFSNSLATDLDLWAPRVAPLADRYRILCHDTRGHGKTTAPVGRYTPADPARDTRPLLNALGIARSRFAGLSLGSFLDAHAAV